MYDLRTYSIQRTKVIDDQSDYFAVENNSWLSKDERDSLMKREKELREKMHASHRNKTVTLDFASRRVVEENSEETGTHYLHVRTIL